MGKHQEQNQRLGFEQLPAGWNRVGKTFQRWLFSTPTHLGVSESDSPRNVCDKQREDCYFQTQSRWGVQVQWMWEIEKLGGQMDLQIGNLPWAIWLKWTRRDEKKDKGWLLNNGGQIRGMEKENQGSGGFPGAGWRAKDVWMQWQSFLTIWLRSPAMFSTIGKVVQMWTKTSSLKSCGRELKVQVSSSHNHRLEEIIFVKLFLSVLKSVYISAVQVYFCLCDQALWSEI